MTDQSPRQSGPQGADLARIALRHAREAARRGRPQSGRRPRQPRKAAGRPKPVLLSVMVAELITEMGWGRPETVAILSLWPELVGSIAANLRAVDFDPDTGTLTLASESSAWATQAHLISKQLISRLNIALDSPTVRALCILRPAVSEPVAGRPSEAEAEPVLQAALSRQDAALPREPEHVFTAGQDAKARSEQADIIRARALARARSGRPGPS